MEKKSIYCTIIFSILCVQGLESKGSPGEFRNRKPGTSLGRAQYKNRQYSSSSREPQRGFRREPGSHSPPSNHLQYIQQGRGNMERARAQNPARAQSRRYLSCKQQFQDNPEYKTMKDLIRRGRALKSQILGVLEKSGKQCPHHEYRILVAKDMIESLKLRVQILEKTVQRLNSGSRSREGAPRS